MMEKCSVKTGIAWAELIYHYQACTTMLHFIEPNKTKSNTSSLMRFIPARIFANWTTLLSKLMSSSVVML